MSLELPVSPELFLQCRASAAWFSVCTVICSHNCFHIRFLHQTFKCRQISFFHIFCPRMFSLLLLPSLSYFLFYIVIYFIILYLMVLYFIIFSVILLFSLQIRNKVSIPVQHFSHKKIINNTMCLYMDMVLLIFFL